MPTDSLLSISLVESNRRRGELLLVGVRWAEGAGRSLHLSSPEFAWVRRGLSGAMWYSGSPVKGGEWRGVSTGAAPSTDGTGGAPRGGQGSSLVCPFGSRFSVAMLMQSWGPVYVLGRGWIPRRRQPPCHKSGGLPYIRHSRSAMCRASICSRVMNWVGRV